jgi:hydrogenase assembly chaperone HypC/HupF
MSCSVQHHCITCSDEGVPMLVVAIDERRDLALCEDSGGARSSVEIALVAGVACGDTLLVHAGTALTRMDGAAA